MKNWNTHLSWRHNGFGFMVLWVNGLYIQFGTVKLIVSRRWTWGMEPVSPHKDDGTYTFGQLAARYMDQQGRKELETDRQTDE